MSPLSALVLLTCTLAGCQYKCQEPEIDFRSNNNRHGIIFDTSSEADTRLMEAMRNMKEGILRMQLTGNADYDLMRMLKIYQDGINVMARTARTSFKSEQLKQVTSRILNTKTPDSWVIDSIYLNRNNPDFDSSNINKGLGREICEFKNSIRTDTSLPSSFDHQFAVLTITHLRNSIRLGEITERYAKNAELKAWAAQNSKSQKSISRKLQMLLNRH